MLLRQYYGDPFRDDLGELLAGAPPACDHGIDEVTIQPRTLSTDNPAVFRWDTPRRGLFASALFLTILADQVCYTYFRRHYPPFRELTRYPKFRGACPGGCTHHINPAGVFSAIGKPPGAWPRDDKLDYSVLPRDLFDVMHDEVMTFFPSHLAGIDPGEFWDRCDESIPVGFRLLFMASRERAR
jgi:hypothetical protein